MSVVAVDWNRGRPGGRVFVLDRRCHHGLVGAWMLALGVLAVWHDRRDFPWLPSRR